MRLSDFDDWSRRNHGLLTRDASGLSSDAWRRALQAGTLIRIHPKVARLPGCPTSPTQRIAAGVLAAGRGALASHGSAALLWDLIDHDGPFVHVTYRQPGRHPTIDGVIIHRPTDRQGLTPQHPLNIACTNPLRTLCDLGADEPALVFRAIGRGLSSRLVDLDALLATAHRHGNHGRTGMTALRAAIDAWALDHRPADSILEIAFADLVRRHGLPPVTFHERITGWEVDFRFVGTAVIVECDGWSTHGLDHLQFERDRRRDSDLVAAGWQVLRISYRSIMLEPADTALRIRRVLTRWAHLDVPAVA